MHDLPVHEAVLLLETDRSLGLSETEATRRLERLGPNTLPSAPRKGPLLRFALQFNHPLIYILLAAAAVTLLIGEPVDASVIVGVVLVNAVIGFIQEGRAERALEALVAMVSPEATVVRDGERRRIRSTHIVPGDLLVLAAGDAVAADVRVVEARELKVDESCLTGESLPVTKVETVLASDTTVADRSNMAFAATLVTRGEGLGVVVATGAETEIGLIHRLIGEAAELATPLTRKIAHFSKLLTWAILALAGATYVIGLARGEDPADLLVAAVALAVGAIPEGLPAALTITLAIGVSRMAQRHAIVRRLPAVETLGSTTVICTDKTGTLTENQMTVQAIVAGGCPFTVGGTGYRPAGEITPERESADGAAALRACLLAGALCNDARLVERDGAWGIVGDPTEAALLVSARKGGVDPDRAAAGLPRIDAIPFESERQFMATLHDGGPDTRGVANVKGAVERVLAMCSRELEASGRAVVLDREAVLAAAHELGARGLRVLAFARGEPDAADGRLEVERLEGRLTFVGLQGMMDPLRPEVIAAVASCQAAGIAVKMITGDHAATAGAIARQIGLDAGGSQDAPPPVMTGTEIAACSEAQLEEVAQRTAVFARVSPEQKLRLVQALQRRGEITAMTGDGVNDAPALKQADIGVAMGGGGTEVARESADIVLTDDNFASIEAAVEEGRRTFDNLTKFIVWTLPTNMGEGLLILTAIAAGVTLPILPVQILWINMTTAVALGLMLAFERMEAGIMTRPPRDPARPLLTGELIGRILLVSALLLGGAFGLFEWAQARGMPVAEARTVAVNVFVVGEMFYLLNCRSLERSMFRIGVFSNPWVSAGIATMIVLQAVFTYAPPMHSLFHSAPIDADAWARIVAVGLVIWGVVGTEKWLRRAARERSARRGRAPDSRAPRRAEAPRVG
ncbi:MAG: HAD-IC family P-type ATPase [Candidatus Nanopelagicales bacterium]